MNFNAAKLGKWCCGEVWQVRESNGEIIYAGVSHEQKFLGAKLEEGGGCQHAVPEMLKSGLRNEKIDGDNLVVISKLTKSCIVMDIDLLADDVLNFCSYFHNYIFLVCEKEGLTK